MSGANHGAAGFFSIFFEPVLRKAALGRAFGPALYILVPERRHVTLISPGLCVSHLAPAEKSAVARRHFAAFGRSILALGCWWWATAERIRRLGQLEGAEKSAAFKDRPVILLVPRSVGIAAGWLHLAPEQCYRLHKPCKTRPPGEARVHRDPPGT